MEQKKTLIYVGNKLSKHGLSVTPVESLGDLLKEKFNVIQVSDKKNIFLRLSEMLLTVYRNRKKVSYILIDTYSTLNFYYAFLVSRLSHIYNIKYICFLHGGSLPERLDKSPKLTKLLFKQSYANVAPSGYLKAEFEKRTLKCLYIPNTIEIKDYKFTKREFSPNTNVKAIKLLWVRALQSIYNPCMAIQVIYELIQRGYQPTLCMVGPDKDGSLEKCKKLATEYNITENIRYTGKLTKKNWLDLSQEYDIFLNTTDFDNMPISVIESMALGIPVISTNAGGLPYFINDGIDGILVDKNDVKSMTDKIIEIISCTNRSYNNLSVNGRIKAETFDWSIVKEKWFNILN